VGDDALRRGLVVVRSDDEESVYAQLVRVTGEVDRVRGRVRARVGDDGSPVFVCDFDSRREELELLLVGERRRFAGRAGDNDPVRPFSSK
jgi:hypothetical protein